VEGAAIMRIQKLAMVVVGLTISMLSAAQTAPKAPRIGSINPPDVAPGTSITISGADFGLNRGIVWIANGPAEIKTWTTNSIVATVPTTAVSGSVWVGQKDPDSSVESGYSFVWSNGGQSVTLPAPPISKTGI
jgi:IPT/TIG domain